MQARKCPNCGAEWYSAAAEAVWICDVCGAEIPVEVGCHCTDSGDAPIICAWCEAKAALDQAG